MLEDNDEKIVGSFSESEILLDENSKEKSNDELTVSDGKKDNSPVKKSDALGKDPIGKLLLRLALPAIVAQIINMLYNIVDRVYIARLGDNAALSGLTVCFPILMIVSAFAALVGMGGAPLASIKLGQGKKEDAEKIMGNSFVMLGILSVVLTVVLILARKPILTLFGATSSSLPYADSYIFIYLIGTVFIMMALGLNNYINAQGFSRMCMMTIIIGAVINIVLDPILIFGFKMGVQGAAIATIVAQAVSALWVLWFLCGKKTVIKLRFKNFKPALKVMLPILALGVSPFIMQSTESLVQLTFNASFKHYSISVFDADQNIAAMGVVFTVLQMLTMPIMGMGQGAQPIISYNYGAGKIDRVKKTFRLLLIWSAGLSVFLMVMVEIFPRVFAFPVSPSPEVLELAAKGLRIFMAGTFLLGVQFACQNTLVALGQSKISLFLALLRKVILLIPLALIFPLFISPPSTALFLSEPVADIIAACTTFTCYMVISKKLFKKMESSKALLGAK